MKDYLTDIVKHTHGLGFINLIKVIGDKKSTTLNASADDRSVIISATFKKPRKEFEGIFGMPSLGTLNLLINSSEYTDNNAIAVVKNDNGAPTGLHFKSANNDFRSEYRFMGEALINEKIKAMKFNEPSYDVILEPNLIGVHRLKLQSQLVPDEETFTAVVTDTKLTFSFGDHSSNAGWFVFSNAASPTLIRPWKYPIGQVLGILNLDGDKIMQFSNNGALVINVDSGLIKYQYVIPAYTK